MGGRVRLAVDLAAHDLHALNGCELCFTTHDDLLLGFAAYENDDGPCERDEATLAVWDDSRLSRAHYDHAVACLGAANVEPYNEGTD